MKSRFTRPVASAAAALVLLGACSGDGPTTLAKGEDVGFVGGAPGLSDHTMDINAEEDDGQVTGEARLTPAGLTVDLQCADTDADDLVIVGGAATESAPSVAVARDWVAVIIREGEPDRVNLWFEGGDDLGSCQRLLDAIPEDLLSGNSGELAEVTDGDIETG